MITLAVLMILGSFLGMCVYALGRARLGRAEALRVQQILEEIAPTRIADAPAAGKIHVTGRVTGKGGAVVTAPFTGGDAVWARASLHTNIGQVVKEWIESVDTLVIDDGTGRVVHVRPRGANLRLPRVNLGGAGHEERIAAYLDGRGWKKGEDDTHFEYESALRPGETISAIGTARAPEGAYRESGAAISLSADDGELLLFDADEEMKNPEQQRSNAGCATFGIVFFALAMLVTAYIGYIR